MSYNVSIPATVPRTLIRTQQLNPVLTMLRGATAGTVLKGAGAGQVTWGPITTADIPLFGTALPSEVLTGVSPGVLDFAYPRAEVLSGVLGSQITGADIALPVSGTAERGTFLISSYGTPASGPVTTWGTRDALAEYRDMNEASIDSTALLIRYVEDTPTSPAPVVRSGIHINGWTGIDRGESSCMVAVQTGAGGAGVFYRAQAMRPPNKPDLGYALGQAIEVCSQDMGPGIYVASGGMFPISHPENAYPTLTQSIATGTLSTFPVTDLARMPTPGAAGVYAPGSWPTPLYFQCDSEYFSYTGKAAASGPGNLTGVTRAVNSAQGNHAVGAQAIPIRPNHAIDVALIHPTSKGIIIEPTNGQFDSRAAIVIATRAIGQLVDAGPRLTVRMNGDIESAGGLTCVNVNAQGGVTALTTTRKRTHSSAAALTAGNVALSAGWGSTASVPNVAGGDDHFSFTVQSAGTGQGPNPTITITFADGTWVAAPTPLVSRQGGFQWSVGFDHTISATQLVITFGGTPTAGEFYRFGVVLTGR